MDFSGNSWLKALHKHFFYVLKNAKKVPIGSEILNATELYFLYTQPIKWKIAVSYIFLSTLQKFCGESNENQFNFFFQRIFNGSWSSGT